MARRPSARIIRLTTVASTGRRMKISVKRIAASLFRNLRIGREWRCHLVVDDNRRAVIELGLAGGRNDIPRLDAVEHRDLVAAGRPGLDEGLVRDAFALAL